MDLQMTSVVVSLLTALPVFCMGIFAPLAGKLSEKWGIEWTIGLSVLLIGVSTALRLVATFPLFLLVTAILSGIGIAITGPLISGYIKKEFNSLLISSSLNLQLFVANIAAIPCVVSQIPAYNSLPASVLSPVIWHIIPITSSSPCVDPTISIRLFSLKASVINNSLKRKPWMLLCASSSFIGIMMLIMGGISPIFCAMLTGIGAGGLFPLAMILPLDATTTPKEASEWTAMIQFGGYIISGIIPMLVGVIKDITNTFDVALFTLLFIIIVIMGLTLKVKTKTESATIRVLPSR